MKKILISQNIKINQYGELIHIIEDNWYKYLSRKKVILIPVFDEKKIADVFKYAKPDGVIFSGGNSLSKFHKNKENNIRDKFEKKLLIETFRRNIPVLGVCRGFQFIADYFGAKIKKTENHIKPNHRIVLSDDIFLNQIINVNSYHNYSIKNLDRKFEIIGKHSDGSIEIARFKKKKVFCTMFHPERKNQSQKIIDKLIKKNFLDKI